MQTAATEKAPHLLKSFPETSFCLSLYFTVFFLPSLRQNLREKHSRHVADLRAYYESEIQALRDKLNLRDLPQDIEKANKALTKRCALFMYIQYTHLWKQMPKYKWSLTGPYFSSGFWFCTLFIYRCKQLEKALAEANFRIQELEGINGSLEEKLVTFLQTFFYKSLFVYNQQPLFYLLRGLWVIFSLNVEPWRL